ncbi:MAG: nuclear transport factor 2 family protein [Verrucomicrobia bacterium]|nr:nuclear transport factor 2 family protein [Cytophagales bacterium]
MENLRAQRLIENYINAYNQFDVDGMVENLHENIVFKNVTNNEITLETKGIEAFETQATTALQFFTHREQIITHFIFAESQVEVAIDYTGVLALDLPDGLKSGETLHLQGKSIFTFQDEKIISIEDIS